MNMHDQRLAAAHREYERLISGLSERVLKLRLTSLANKGPNELDPFIRALARRELEAMEYRGAASAAQAELDELKRIPAETYFPGQPNKRADIALRREELERKITDQSARLMLRAMDPMVRARKEAVVTYDAQEAAMERMKAIADRVAAKKAAQAEAELDAAADRAMAGAQAVAKK